MPTPFQAVLNKFRKQSFSERDKGTRFERLMQAYLLTDPKYAPQFKNVWLWNEFPAKKDFGGKDTGIDLVAMTHGGDYWAIQCKCFQESTSIDKPAVDSFLSTSSKTFLNENLQTVRFSQRLWISTTNHWGPNAETTIRHQHPPVTRINLHDLEVAPVDWEKLEHGLFGEASRAAKKTPLPHQIKAIDAAHEYFQTSDRGKLIMACGTGKTFTSLKIAENETGGKGLILFLVPSIALLGQTLREWFADAGEPIHAICICSDTEVSRKKSKNEDSDGYSVMDLALPASTDVKSILHQFRDIRKNESKGMTVVFSTYQSIEVIANAQAELIRQEAYGIFDLIVCDEAHRTTGITLAEEDSSAFVKVHDNNFLRAKKRLYMTATPRLYNDDSKSKAAQAEAILCSMDDVQLYGEEIYRIGFGEAVEKDLLSDYKVLILTVSENDMPASVQQMVADENNEINSDDASKLIGCINALSKQILGDAGVLKESDPDPMRRAVAFCQNIKTSKKITETFNTVTSHYHESLPEEKREKMAVVVSDHVDGTMSAPVRDEKLSWLKSPSEESNECRILTNVRCLSEGVDVPSLDAVLFLSARNSQVDVVQSVGRVMRKAPGKKYGYIIIPVVVPANIEADKALDDNERYKVVWTVLNALRAHDDRFNATVNKIELNKKRPNQILVGRPDNGYPDVPGSGSLNDSEAAYGNASAAFNQQLTMQFNELQNVIFARMVLKVGDRRYWEQWAKDVAQIAERHIARINKLIGEEGEHQKAFQEFLTGLQKNINPSITASEAVEMLSQHIITKPVFEALFEGYSFVQNNAISVSMQKMLDLLEAQSIEKDTETLQKFYESVKTRAKVDNAEARQRIIVELYDKFFKTAFPKMVEKLGIVYTPIEVVDFIIHSVDAILQKEFGRSISDENIHILDPFTGTGTFITRLLQSGLIKPEDLERKYASELHANEIVLLAYYIAAINIENTFHDLRNTDEYKPFDGICLTDTFQLGETDESEKLFSEMFVQNSDRVIAQKKAPLRVIMGNPPYSVGQKSANDNAQNQSYPKLDARISATYVKESAATSVKDLYNSYFKAFRWASDRLDKENGGVLAFITNSGWIDGNDASGFRNCIEKEFSSIYVFNLRGAINGRSGDTAKKEGQNVFNIMTGVAITILVKKRVSSEKANIQYYNIGDFLSRKEKLSIIDTLKSIGNPNIDWKKVNPNEYGDWINQRNDIFGTFIPIEPEKKFDVTAKSYFVVNSLGVNSNRDAWVYNSSKKELELNMQKTIAFYNEQVKNYSEQKRINPNLKALDFINTDHQEISWSSSLIPQLERGNSSKFESEKTVTALYRPFHKRFLYFGDKMIHRRGQFQDFFPSSQSPNKMIITPGIGERKGFSALMSDSISDLNMYDGGCQCFPLYYYEERKIETLSLFDEPNNDEFTRRDGISDFILQQATKAYGKAVTKEDLFYYVYGFLHSPEYRTQFASDLKKMLPRIPLVDEPRDFWSFSKAGRKLADLHLHYETIPPFEGVTINGEAPYVSKILNDNHPSHTGDDYAFFQVEKMRFPKKDQKDTIIYNSRITIQNIPAQAYSYIVNGKSAIEWIIERYQITTHKDSAIRNDPNDWSRETGNPRYILDLLLSVINVSVQTVGIIEKLPDYNV